MQKTDLDILLGRVQKPGRYTGGEVGSVIKRPNSEMLRFAFCFPDLYEIGMSHLGMKILYSLLNAEPDIWCERVFAPAPDMEAQLRAHGMPLYALESLEGIGDFDILGFTLQYELSYSAILNMLDLAGVPLKSSERTGFAPLVIAGGPCACNPEPIADFIDIFILGEGEEVTLQLCRLCMRAKAEGWSKRELLVKAAELGGVYVPSLYDVSYKTDGTIAAVTAAEGAPLPVGKAIVKDIDNIFYPESFVVPFIETVHDRAVVEIFRGCIRGCRFCQAGFIYRPYREKLPSTLSENARKLIENTGYDELSLSSLSTSDYSGLEPLLDDLLSWCDDARVSLSLPSLRVDNFSPEVLAKVAKMRKSGLTFAPEAGSQRMRDVINKNVTEEELMQTARIAFAEGYSSIKLYFMIGLPGETDEDILAIVDLAQKVIDLHYSMPDRPRGKQPGVTVSVATFVPKPFTPFMLEPQDTPAEVERKHRLLRDAVRSSRAGKKITLNYHDSDTSFLEAVFARGDRRLGEVLLAAYKKGARLDGWNEHFKLSHYTEAMAECGLDTAFHAHRRRSPDEVLPWEHLDYGVSKRFLLQELGRATQAMTTPHCRENCTGCGANGLLGGACFE